MTAATAMTTITTVIGRRSAPRISHIELGPPSDETISRRGTEEAQEWREVPLRGGKARQGPPDVEVCDGVVALRLHESTLRRTDVHYGRQPRLKTSPDFALRQARRREFSRRILGRESRSLELRVGLEYLRGEVVKRLGVARLFGPGGCGLHPALGAQREHIEQRERDLDAGRPVERGRAEPGRTAGNTPVRDVPVPRPETAASVLSLGTYDRSSALIRACCWATSAASC